MNAHEWFRTIAASLNDDKPDHPFRRYLLKDLVAYFNDAVCMIAKHRPELFMERKNIKLQCGSYQDTRGCCSNISQIIAQTDVNGNIIRELSTNRKTDTKVRSVWNKPSCLTAAHRDPVTGNPLGYMIDTVSLDIRDNNGFSVYPPVPAQGDYFALVNCQAAPCLMTEAGVLDGSATMAVDCGYLAAVRFFVMGWALAGDRHSSAAQAESTRMFSLFFQWLGVAEAQEKKFEEKIA